MAKQKPKALTIKEFYQELRNVIGTEGGTTRTPIRFAIGPEMELELLSIYYAPETKCIWVDLERENGKANTTGNR